MAPQLKSQDSAFLDSLYEAWLDSPYAEILTANLSPARLEFDGIFDWLAREGIYHVEEKEQVRHESLQILDSRAAFRGHFIESLRSAALEMVPANVGQLGMVPVGLLPTRQLNACAVPTPTGGAVIVLDHAVVLLMMTLIRLTRAFATYDQPQPFTRAQPWEAYGLALVALAKYCLTGRGSYLAPFEPVVTFSDMKDPDQTTISWSFVAELFILLHEYGHVALNHLDRSRTDILVLTASVPIYQYTKSQQQEFDADAYALRCLLQHGSARNIKDKDLAFAIGTLLNFFDLCDAIRTLSRQTASETHPAGWDRWAAIRNAVSITSTALAHVTVLEVTFRFLEEHFTTPL